MHRSNIQSRTWLTLALCLASTNASPVKKRSTGSSTLPYCFYNYNSFDGNNCPDAPLGPVGAPVSDYCQQAMQAVCTAISQLADGDQSEIVQSVGNGTLHGQGADCYVGAANGHNHPALSYDDCMQGLGGIAGCFETTNQGFDADCVGGTQNQQFNTDNVGRPVDSNQPWFGLGPPWAMGIVDGDQENLVQPSPQLQSDRTSGQVPGSQNANAGAAAKPAAPAPNTAGRVGAVMAGFEGVDVE